MLLDQAHSNIDSTDDDENDDLKKMKKRNQKNKIWTRKTSRKDRERPLQLAVTLSSPSTPRFLAQQWSVNDLECILHAPISLSPLFS